jgi:hypothetical protein
MRTTIVPKGRGPYKSFEESAVDSLVKVQKYKKDRDWSLPMYMWTIEGYNGYGYHAYNIPSPYLVGGSNKQKSGKFYEDHKFSYSVWDTQLGVITLLKALIELDPTIKFGVEEEQIAEAEAEDVPAESDANVPAPLPVVKSQGGTWRQLAVVGTAATGMLASVEFKVICFLAIAAIAGWAVWNAQGKPKIWTKEYWDS